MNQRICLFAVLSLAQVALAQVPVTLHMNFVGRPPAPDDRQRLSVQVMMVDSEGIRTPYNGQTDRSGNFVVPGGLYPGQYLAWVKSPKFLALTAAVTVSYPSTQANIGNVIPGDCNGDNLANALDFVILKG